MAHLRALGRLISPFFPLFYGRTSTAVQVELQAVQVGSPTGQVVSSTLFPSSQTSPFAKSVFPSPQ
jgi:hypothetical protein